MSDLTHQAHDVFGVVGAVGVGTDAAVLVFSHLVLVDHPFERAAVAEAVELHGATVMGSTRGALHCWTIDLDKWTADCDAHYSYRQIHERDAPLRIRPLVDEIAQLILDGKDDKRLKWFGGRAQVRVLVREFISGRFAQTREGRRKKLRLGLNAALEPRGWQSVPPARDLYSHTVPSNQ